MKIGRKRERERLLIEQHHHQQLHVAIFEIPPSRVSLPLPSLGPLIQPLLDSIFSTNFCQVVASNLDD